MYLFYLRWHPTGVLKNHCEILDFIRPLGSFRIKMANHARYTCMIIIADTQLRLFHFISDNGLITK